MFNSPQQALEKLGREIRRLEEAEDRDNVVEIDVNDCYDSIFNAALTGWHLIDWAFKNDSSLSEEMKESEHHFGLFRKDREKECPELSLCGDIANKIKHAKITRTRTIDGRTDMETANTSFIGMEISEKGIRTNVQKSRITLNGENAVDIFSRVFDYWSNYFAPRIGTRLEKPHKVVSQRSSGSMLARPGGYYCSTCKIAIGMLIPHRYTCSVCGNPYQDIP